MTILYRNSTPNMYFTGTKDFPKPGLQNGVLATPLHLPLCPLNTQWGPVGMPILCMGDEYVSKFGAESFNVRGAYYNHQTTYSKMFQGNANAQFVYRMDTNAKKGTARLCIEYVAKALPVAARNLDGTIKRTPAGQIELVDGATVQGYLYRLIVKSEADLVVGGGSQMVGTLVGDEGAAAVILPLMDFQATHPGLRGNFAINIFQPKTFNPQAVDATTINEQGDMIYRMYVGEQPKVGGTVQPWYTVGGREFIDFALMDGVYNTKGAVLSFNDVYASQYIADGQMYSGLDIDGAIDNTHLYTDNVLAVSTLFHAAEVAANSPAFTHETNVTSINLMGDTDHKNVPYSALKMVGMAEATPETYLPSEGSQLRLTHASDGDLSLSFYDANVARLCDSFGIAQPNLADLKRFPFHFIWDSGFSTETTLKLQSLMGKRPDLFVGAATFVDGAPLNTVADEMAIATQLAANAALYPESVIYKTAATRGTIMPWAIKLNNHEYTKPASLNYDFADKVSQYLGSGDGKWVTAKALDKYPNNVIKHKILNYTYEPLSIREDMWGSQMVAVEFGDVAEIIYAGMQTIQPNESSVLNTFPVVAATIHTTWACIKVNTKYVGQSISSGLLVMGSDELIAEYTAGIDVSKARVTPMTTITPEDNGNGYAWTTRARVDGNGSKTVNTIEIQSGFLD